MLRHSLTLLSPIDNPSLKVVIMLKSEYIAYRFLTPNKVKIERIMQSAMPFAIRLAAVNALDTNKGKCW